MVKFSKDRKADLKPAELTECYRAHTRRILAVLPQAGIYER